VAKGVEVGCWGGGFTHCKKRRKSGAGAKSAYQTGNFGGNVKAGGPQIQINRVASIGEKQNPQRGAKIFQGMRSSSEFISPVG